MHTWAYILYLLFYWKTQIEGIQAYSFYMLFFLHFFTQNTQNIQIKGTQAHSFLCYFSSKHLTTQIDFCSLVLGNPKQCWYCKGGSNFPSLLSFWGGSCHQSSMNIRTSRQHFLPCINAACMGEDFHLILFRDSKQETSLFLLAAELIFKLIQFLGHESIRLKVTFFFHSFLLFGWGWKASLASVK